METIKKIWEDFFEKSLTYSISEISEKYLKPLGLEAIYIEQQFTENESNFFGVYIRSLNLLKDGKIAFSINRDKLFSEMKRLGYIKEKNTRMQVHILTYHEIGHGLIDFIKNMKFENPTLHKNPPLRKRRRKTCIRFRTLSRKTKDIPIRFRLGKITIRNSGTNKQKRDPVTRVSLFYIFSIISSASVVFITPI